MKELRTIRTISPRDRIRNKKKQEFRMSWDGHEHDVANGQMMSTEQIQTKFRNGQKHEIPDSERPPGRFPKRWHESIIFTRAGMTE